MTMALVGQPNCGKSTLFNSVAGYRSITANFPGVTVHYTRSRILLDGSIAELIDLPGIYSLTASSPAESATRDFLLNEEVDVVINVIDASVLSRSLELTLQLLELGVPLVVCLNMTDEAHRKGIRINPLRLSKELGVPITETIAAEGVGIHALFQSTIELNRDSRPLRAGLSYHRDTESVIDDLASLLENTLTDQNQLPARLVAIKVLEGDECCLSRSPVHLRQQIEDARLRLAENRGKPADEVIESERHALSMQLFESVAEISKPPHDIRERIDAWLTHKVWGYVIMLTLLAGFFSLVYGVGTFLEPQILSLFEGGIASIGKTLDPNGLGFVAVKGILQGLAGGIAIVLPYLLPFLLGMAILEDVGYLPRVAFLMDAFMHRMGLHGIAIVPAILGYGCNVPAVMATRILTSPRDRFIASVIATLIPCSARMTVIFGLVAFYIGPLWALMIYALNILVIAFSGKILSSIMPESSPGMILEVPPYHLPKLEIIFRKTWLRLREFIVVAWPLLIAGSLLLSMGTYYRWDAAINRLLTPLISLLGLPEVVGTTLIFGVLRKELSMIMLFQALGTSHVISVMSMSQIVVFTLFVTFYIPCVATMAALFREVGWKLALSVAAYSLAAATVIGLIGRWVLLAMGVS